MTKYQIGNLQVIRALAALSVVLDHTFATSFKGLVSEDNYEYIHTLLNDLGWFGVNVFFVLSGFLMIFTQNDEKKSYRFIYDRIIRIYPAYILLSIPIIIFALTPSQYDHRIYNTYQLVQNIILMPGWEGMSYSNANYPAWTLVYEMFFYIIFSGVLLFSRKKSHISIAISLILVCLIVIYKSVLNSNGTQQLTDIKHLLGNLILLNFAAGCLLGAFFKKGNLNVNGKLFLIATILIFGLSSVVRMKLSAHSGMGADIIFGTITASIVIYIALCSQEIKNRVIKIIGDASYSIYLTHVTLLLIKNKIMNMLGLFDSIYSVLLCNIIFVPISISVGIMSYQLVERPLMNILKKVTYLRKIERPE
ncbi:acyltransferase [Klebsiella michiganensis]|uniref:acyltransferase family protein n=1 Tax=Klebsiella michiganensis TaxID=1134687 RepID=UPI003132A12D